MAEARGEVHRNETKDEPSVLYVAHSMPHVPLFVSDKIPGQIRAAAYGDVIMEIDWFVGEILNALKKKARPGRKRR